MRTLRLSNPGQPDVLRSRDGKTVFYDRRLNVEVWYPADLQEGEQPGSTYLTTTRNPAITANLHGQAVRDALALESDASFPLIIISHGYPGNRFLMAHLAENLASKGYVVASIDHRESTYEDQQAFASTLFHRPLDQVFVLDEMARLAADASSFLASRVDVERTGIVGYSMGGYGLLINMGAGLSEAALAHEAAPVNGLAVRHAAVNPDFAARRDPRIKAGIAIAPWGMAEGIWDPTALHNISAPLFLLVGSRDETVGYENGVREIYRHAANSDRCLLTFQNAGHNAIAPIPLPVEIQRSDDKTGAYHYTDAVWDSTRSSNIMAHFATAFFDLRLKGMAERQDYLDLVPRSNDGVYAVKGGKSTNEHSYWQGFPQYTARGLLLECALPTE